MPYFDGFIAPGPKKKVDAYRRRARKAATPSAVTFAPCKSTHRRLFAAARCSSELSSIPGQNSSPSRSTAGNAATAAKLFPVNLV